MPETEHGILYPESTDHTRLWEHFQNLAESADTALPDLTVVNTVTYNPTGNDYGRSLQATRFSDGLVVLVGQLARIDGSYSTAWHNVGITLQQQHCPRATIIMPTAQIGMSGDLRYRFQIANSGLMQAQLSGATSGYLWFNLAYQGVDLTN